MDQTESDVKAEAPASQQAEPGPSANGQDNTTVLPTDEAHKALTNGAASPTLAAALALLDAGYSVIPVRGPYATNGQRPKQPLVSWDVYQTRCATPDEARGWFEQWPDAWPGLVTGAISGVDALDVDVKSGGVPSDWADVSPVAQDTVL